MSSKSLWITLVAGSLLSAVAVAQRAPVPPAAAPAAPAEKVFFISNAAPLPVFGGQIDIVRGEGDVLGPVVEGKPYSARSITESTQTLADGNRIVQRNETRIFRDSQGRTRREQTLGGVGQWQTAGDPQTMITINDPVAGRSYVIDPTARTGREIGSFEVAIAQAEGGADAAKVVEIEKMVAAGPGAPGGEAVTWIRTGTDGRDQVQVFARGVAVTAPLAKGKLVTEYPEEDLGEQVLEGLLVKGTRVTNTIPAGAVGNDRAIDIVTERWYSEDIQAMVLQRFSDPRVGETVYQLVNVALGDPSPDLFALPAGFDVIEQTVEVSPGAARLETRRFILEERERAKAE